MSKETDNAQNEITQPMNALFSVSSSDSKRMPLESAISQLVLN